MDNIYEVDEQVEFKAIITDCRYYNDDTTWGVYQFATDENIPYYITSDDNKSNYGDCNYNKFSTLAGKMQELVIGGEYQIKATHKYDKKYGHQYVPISVFALIPQTKETQLLFLKSIIPESIAENLINAYPNIVNDVANGTIKEIDYSLVKGVREITWNRIKDKIVSNYLISDIIVMLKPLGVTYTMIKKLLSEEPNPALLKQEIEKNPYILTKINGLGFKRVDELALKMNPELIDSSERLIAYVKYFLTEMGENDGNTWCSISILKSAISNFVPECIDNLEWLLSNKDFLHIEGDRVGLTYYYNIEMKILSLIKEKIDREYVNEIPERIIEKAISEAEKEQGFTYTNEQLMTIKKALKINIVIIGGKAGTGKSSIMRAIIKAYQLNTNVIVASALSAMAAQRITEATNFPAMTAHRTLGCKGFNEFTFNKDNPLIADVSLLDEGSMVNANIFLNWLEAIGENTRIIISGDNKQLPPIGFGNVFSDLIEILGDKVVCKLTKPMRQAQKSGILVDANLIRENKNPITETLQPRIVHGELKDMVYMFRNNRESLFNIAIKTFLKSIEEDGLDNVVIAVPRKQGCLNSAFEINKFIQNKLLSKEKNEISYGDSTFKLGAKVMQTVNDYNKNVFNGEIGYITKIDISYENKKPEKYCVVTFDTFYGKNPDEKKKDVIYTKKELAYLELAYALTVHKLQGSGRKTVIGIVDNTHYQLFDNCMLYTLLTRAKKRCLLLSEPQAFMKCIRTSHNKRNTWISIENNNM